MKSELEDALSILLFAVVLCLIVVLIGGAYMLLFWLAKTIGG